MNNMNVRQGYDGWSAIYDTNINLTRDLDAIVTQGLLANHRFDSILELGCGTGKNTEFLAQIGVRVHALDFSEGMIRKAKKKIKSQNVRFEKADLRDRWPCDDNAYDLIACNLVLEHIENLSHIFAESARTLRIGGMVLIQELHPFRQYNGVKAHFEQEGKTVEVDAFTHHISEFIHEAENHQLKLEKFGEHWHQLDEGKPPRLVSFIFIKD